MALFMWSMKQEDYENSPVDKELVLERVLKIPIQLKTPSHNEGVFNMLLWANL